jgi:hypothetical protein
MAHARPTQRRACRRAEREKLMNPAELKKLDAYFKRLFQNPRLTVKARPRINDSCELYIGDEFLGVISKIVDEGETSYDLSMSILDIDLE